MTIKKYNTSTVERNIKTRMAALSLDVRKIAAALNITKPAIYKRIARLSEVDIYWWSTVLVVHPDHLISEDVIHIASTPLLPAHWIYKIKHLIGEEFNYEALLRTAYNETENVTTGRNE